MKNKDLDFETKAIHIGQDPDPVTGAVIPPIYTTSTYAQESPGEHKGYDYSRTSNPTRHAFEVCVASLEEGEKAHAFSSGVAAISACVELLQPGDHIIAMDDLYGGTVRLFNEIKSISQGIEISYVDMSKEENIEASIKPNTKMLFAETPTNPLLKIIDLEKLADFARSKNIITVADNTFCSPYIQRPLTKGFDYVIHSATKYLCGHSDVIMGVLVMKDAETDNSKRLSNIHNSLGPISSPFDSYLALRSLKTLALRMERHSSNAEKMGSGFMTMPGPPPKGLSSVSLCFPSAQRRKSREFTSIIPESIARPTILSPINPSSVLGKRERTSKRRLISILRIITGENRHAKNQYRCNLI